GEASVPRLSRLRLPNGARNVSGCRRDLFARCGHTQTPSRRTVMALKAKTADQRRITTRSRRRRLGQISEAPRFQRVLLSAVTPRQTCLKEEAQPRTCLA